MQTATVSPVLKYPGSKWSLADWIIQHMPPHESYLEPYFGSGAVFFRKRPVDNETLGDINGDIVNLFKMVRDRCDELAALVEMTPWSRYEYESIETSATDPEIFIHSGDPLEDARRFLVRCWMAYGAKTDGKVGWACNIRPNRYGCIIKRWNRLPENIMIAADRLKNAQIECQPAAQLTINGAKDGALLKKLLQSHAKDRISRLLIDFFESDDEFITKTGYTIGAFYSVFSKLLVARIQKEMEVEKKYGKIDPKEFPGGPGCKCGGKGWYTEFDPDANSGCGATVIKDCLCKIKKIKTI